MFFEVDFDLFGQWALTFELEGHFGEALWDEGKVDAFFFVYSDV